jgi:hypothetical protein
MVLTGLPGVPLVVETGVALTVLAAAPPPLRESTFANGPASTAGQEERHLEDFYLVRVAKHDVDASQFEPTEAGPSEPTAGGPSTESNPAKSGSPPSVSPNTWSHCTKATCLRSQ